MITSKNKNTKRLSSRFEFERNKFESFDYFKKQEYYFQKDLESESNRFESFMSTVLEILHFFERKIYQAIIM